MPVTFNAGGVDHCLEMIPWRSPKPVEGRPVVVLRVGGEELAFQLTRWPRTGMEEALPPTGVLSRMSGALRRIVATAALGDFIPPLEWLFHDRVEIVDLHLETAKIEYDDAFQFKLDQRPDLVIVSVFCKAKTMQMVLDGLRQWPVADNAIAGVLFPVWMEIGYSVLPRVELSALAVGDVILLEPSEFLARRQIRLTIPPNLEIYLKLEQGKAMIEDIKQDSSVEESQGEPVNIDELNVTLTFDVGKQQLPLHQLKKLHKGYTFELSRPLNQLVTIRCNGQKIGVAELVEVEDRVGMRVVSLIGK